MPITSNKEGTVEADNKNSAFKNDCEIQINDSHTFNQAFNEVRPLSEFVDKHFQKVVSKMSEGCIACSVIDECFFSIPDSRIEKKWWLK
ncbi:MAG: hypothetical protein PQ612_06155 [Rickettsiales bacterium]|nr:hypothetical protein [Pseudomonadota bacterium]MDA0966554.1 hypothetical protein [Pseudomonadota bacterium]MDG4543583.1 hypothetical protein [Rickettsiales bacterium]MDG4545730.1 hypothetical protein [Rickettsiales bacterium]MDG4547497.1 hypothetical protein [Rickettsiales bacterium]